MEHDDYYMEINSGAVLRIAAWKNFDKSWTPEAEGFEPVQPTETQEEIDEWGSWKPWAPKGVS
ncbi:MAG: hypothetical protein ACYDBI_05990 [Thermoplasmataceae archaeon]